MFRLIMRLQLYIVKIQQYFIFVGVLDELIATKKRKKTVVINKKKDEIHFFSIL